MCQTLSSGLVPRCRNDPLLPRVSAKRKLHCALSISRGPTSPTILCSCKWKPFCDNLYQFNEPTRTPDTSIKSRAERKHRNRYLETYLVDCTLSKWIHPPQNRPRPPQQTPSLETNPPRPQPTPTTQSLDLKHPNTHIHHSLAHTHTRTHACIHSQ